MKIKTVYLILLCVALIGCPGNEDATKEKNMKQAIPGKIITIDKLENMFAAISEQSGWDMKKPMVWGYFFTHHEPKLLESAKGRLVENGYRFVDIHLSDKENPADPDKWWLHVEKEEIHTPQSLDKRNDELYLFAHELGLDSYDGMDVGPIEK